MLNVTIRAFTGTIANPHDVTLLIGIWNTFSIVKTQNLKL